MHYSNCNTNSRCNVIRCFADRFVITRLRNSASTHYPFREKKTPSNGSARSDVRSRSCARMQRATAHTLHRRGLRASFTRSGRAAGRHPLSLCARSRARAHAFNYIFASQLPRERKTGREYRSRVGIPPARGRREGYTHGWSTWEIVRCANMTESGCGRKSPAIARALILLLGNRRDRDRSFAFLVFLAQRAGSHIHTDRSVNEPCISILLIYLISRHSRKMLAARKLSLQKRYRYLNVIIIFATS